MEEITKDHVGLDVHQDTIVVGLAEAGRSAGRVIGKVAHNLPKLRKQLDKLGGPQRLHVVYEAGPTGYGLYRKLREWGYECEVIAPSKMPRRPGERVKTDGRDSVQLAECSRAGQLRAVWVPDPEDEAMRDLTRAREDAVEARLQTRQQLKSFLLRHGIRSPYKTAWTKRYHAWLSELKFEAGQQQQVFTEYCLAVKEAEQRVQRHDELLIEAVKGWRFEPLVRSLQAMRGIELVTAASLVAEIGDLQRFDHPRKLMDYLGMVPSEHSSGQRTVRGSITKAGNRHARRLLVEAAWHHRHPARIGRAAQRRQSALPEAVCALAWKAQLRLTKRFGQLRQRGLQQNKVCVAVAREMAGFIWAMAQQVQQEAQPRGPEAAAN
jgi:transposase